jgi:hypothetical protein
MTLSAPEYLSELNAAKHTSPLNWHSEQPGRYEMNVGRLKVVVNHVAPEYRWSLVHTRSGPLHSGSSESLQLAALEALAYAENWVKKGHVEGLLA